MKILIAEDNLISRNLLQLTLTSFGFETVLACDGDEAWEAMQAPAPPPIAVLDWEMPGVDGVELCRRLRRKETTTPAYIILVTVNDHKEQVVEGLEAGANDYIIKPFNPEELRARINVGRAVVELQKKLDARVKELEEAMGRIKVMSELLSICSYCRKLRDDNERWLEIEKYIAENTNSQFSHGICPSCYESEVVPQLIRRGVKS